MGTLVKTAQAVEDRVESVRRDFEPRVRSKLKEARAEWVDLKSRRSGSRVNRTELHFRDILLRTDARFRLEMDKLIGRLILELEKLRRTLPRNR